MQKGANDVSAQVSLWAHGLLQLLAGSAGHKPEGCELPNMWEVGAQGAVGCCAIRMILASLCADCVLACVTLLLVHSARAPSLGLDHSRILWDGSCKTLQVLFLDGVPFS
jgi:hypothetical protein